MNLKLNVDAGELEAICLAQEIHAAAILVDDRAGRTAAVHCGLAVVGTIGLLEQAADSVVGIAGCEARASKGAERFQTGYEALGRGSRPQR